MKKIALYALLGIVFCGLVGCSEATGVDTPPADAEPLPTPTLQVVVAGTSATLKWSVEAPVTNLRFAYEVYRAEATTPAVQGTSRQGSYTFQMEQRVAYRARVKCMPATGVTAYVDSDYSPFVEFSCEDGGEPDEPDEGDEDDEDENGDVTPSELLGLPLPNEADGVLRAFPGAEGGGMYVTGGRGGKVYHVTNLNDSGAGSLREAVQASGARIIVFDVAGTIALQRDLEIKQGNLTIAGQTAPGDGICLRNYPVVVKANNVIIRYLRFRLGDHAVSDGDDTIWGRYQQNIILDHCSMSWNVDECASFYANKNFTMQWCLLGESLHNSGHSKGSHGYGGIWGGAPASFHHNLLAHHDSRNPRFDEPNAYNYTGLQNGKPGTYSGESGFENDERMIDYRNNVVYNFCNFPAYGGEGAHINFVGNYYKWGPASYNGLGVSFDSKGNQSTESAKRRTWFYQVDCAYTTSGVTYDAGPTEVYYTANKLDTSIGTASTGEAITANNAQGFRQGSKSALGDTKYPTTPFAITASGIGCYVTTHSADEAFAKTLAYAGASLARDAVDKRIVSDVEQGVAHVMTGSNGSKNGIIDRPADTASASVSFGQVAADGYPILSATEEQIARAATDTDKDGIPDYYEELFGLDKNSAQDASAKTLDPQGIYPNLEVYFHYLVKEITAAQIEEGSYTTL